MKNLTARLALTTALLGSCALVGLTPAKATTVTFFNSTLANSDPVSSHETFGSGGVTIDANGYLKSGSIWNSIGLYNKNGGAGETGLGLKSDSDHEIHNLQYVVLDTSVARSKGYNLFQFSMGSTTDGEAWSVFGSNDTTIGSGLNLLWSKQTSNGGLFNLTEGDRYYYFTYDGPLKGCGGCNVLLASFAGADTSLKGGQAETTTPLPAALPLFATGLGALGLLGWRRKRKVAAIAA